MNPSITVLLADDHAVLRQGLVSLLKAHGRFTVLGEARNGRETVQLAQALRPDIIVMDIAMPGLNGLEATRQILAANPAAKIVVLSAHSEESHIERLIAAGVVGFLEKEISADLFTRALIDVAGGGGYSPLIQSRLGRDSRTPLDREGRAKAAGTRLTPREAEVLQLVAEGAPNKQIAADLGISIKTVEKHRHQLMTKLGIRSVAGLTRHALATGVIEKSRPLPDA
jgi:DNA-binding NarL/FixJ family response regulator